MSEASRNVRARLQHRSESAFAEEERQGLMLAAKTRTIALLILLAWQIIDNPNSGLAYAFDLSILISFILLGLLQFLCAKWRFHMDLLKYLFVAMDCALLAVALTFENPFSEVGRPTAYAMQGSLFSLFFLFLMQSAFSFRQRLVMWCGACIVAARTGMLLWVVNQPGVFTNIDLPERSPEAFIEALGNPNFVHLGHWFIEIMASLIVASGLAVVVGRSRRLVTDRSLSERARANLARYFSPNVVDRLSGSNELLGTVRQQDVAVLFVDIIGFTKLCEREPAANVIALLRDYHNRLGQAVFDNEGTLDKYIGDGLMATFGTPEPGPNDAGHALQCALDMITALAAWNGERTASGDKAVRIGIGLHYGPVIAGDIGNERRLEYGVIGDTVNIASRLEQLTRQLKTPIVLSDSLVMAIDQASDARLAISNNFVEAGVQHVRGREGGIPVWVLKAEPDGPGNRRCISNSPSPCR
ncbi:MAG: adenylate/guanylate cyclase domain-containing protein [Rhodospirillaceae bacterium]|jgi:adenylate cyclase|nr:adenylate/guanylate cyclase domain-containing protein [Rhodospirillaceae bacterium]MBT4690988.1 adenylate/guanylate cyclase domain-containing protein [Rhodospirillaceae bacterium]MBT5079958.1 adenylate/guanylate cyclase domain-containing protein [Rhodospirillaceae bacterium]MBT5525980.1 adenylate/guanylate cyclase domain-containing protein [Rhodospirillaceae bacterium]MBT5881769.1 adenylate/guanylate cyclase domain-containing protein [Rhodospirillaceae bacterium]